MFMLAVADVPGTIHYLEQRLRRTTPISRNPAAISGPGAQQRQQERHVSPRLSQITTARPGGGQRNRVEEGLVHKPVHKPQSKGLFHDRKRPLTC